MYARGTIKDVAMMLQVGLCRDDNIHSTERI